MRLEALENRELLAADVLTAAATVSNAADFATFADETQPVDVSIPLDLAETETAETVSSAVPEIAAAETGTTWTVTSLLDDGTDGTLRVAINNAAEGDAITFADSLKGGTITLNGTLLNIEKSLTIDASNLYDATTQTPGITIDANQASRVFYVSGGTEAQPVALIGLTIKNGSANRYFYGYGGGIYAASGSSLTLTNTTVSGNNAYVGSYCGSCGGGIYAASGSSLTLTNTTVSGNNAYEVGGGIYANGTLTLTNTTVSGNNASCGGGGIYASGTVTLTNTTVSGNNAEYGYGGGIYADFNSTLTLTNTTVSGNNAARGGGIDASGTLTLTNTTVSGNNAEYGCGGGIYADGGRLTLTNTTVSGNNAGVGGGIYADGGRLTLTNTTVSGNTAEYDGGGIFALGTLTLTNTIVAQNTANESVADVYYDGSTVITAKNVLSSYTAWGKAENTFVYDASQPLFKDAANGDYRLAENSQAIDRGNNNYAVDAAGNPLTTDILGKPRIVGKSIDIGAYEYCAKTDVTTEKDVVDPDDGVTSLREAIAAAETGEYGTTVTFDASLKGKTIALNGSQLNIGRSLTIDASNIYDASTKTPGITVDANQKSRVFYVEGGLSGPTVELKGLKIVGGKAKTWVGGGGIYAGANTSLTLTNSFVSENESPFGGGGIYSSGTLTVTDSTISKNKATSVNSYGGGIYADIGMLTVKGSTISENAAKRGGGIYTAYGEPKITDSTVSKNTSDEDGGGIYASFGELTLTNATISENVAKDVGGGVYSTGTTTATNAAIFGNVSSQAGGIYSQGTLIATNATIAGNVASNVAGGLEAVGTLAARNSIVALNSSKSAPDYALLAELNSSNNAVGFDPGFAVAPKFDKNGELTNASELDLSLKTNAWGIGRGDDSFVETSTDVAGNARVVGTVDLGAYESSQASGAPETPSTVVTTNEDVVDGTDGKISLREAIFYAEAGETITFASELQGEKTTLKGTELFVDKGVGVDASSLCDSATQAPAITIDADGKSRVFFLYGGTKDSSIRLSGLKIVGGSTVSAGGGIYASGTSTLTNLVVAGNKASYGGGIYADSGADLTATNATISGNSASVSGGGICAYRGKITARNTIIAANPKGGDVYNDEGTIDAFNVLSSNYAWSNVDRGVVYNSAKPLFNDAANGDYSLADGSQAIDKGNNAYAVDAAGNPLTTDLAGNARISGESVDIGAYERQVVAQNLTRIGTSTSQPQVGVKITTTLYVGAAKKLDSGATATYQWFRVDAKTGAATAISGATGSTYTPTTADVGYKLRVTATGTGNYAGTVTATHSAKTVATLTRIGTSTSQPQVGTKITTTLYVGTKEASGATAAYQWYRVDAKTGAATAISGATGSSYTPVAADVGYKIRVTATGTGSYKGTVTATHSSATKATQKTALTRIGTSTSQPQVGTKITTTLYVGAAKKLDSGATATYQWYRVDAKTGAATAISGATGSSYTPTAEDVGYKLRVTATGTGAYAETVTATHSNATIAGQATETLTRIGTSTSQPAVGVKITTTLYVGAAKKLDSGATATYQWYRVDASGKATAISGANGSTYTPTTEDVGYKLRVSATGTGNYTGTATATHSNATVAALTKIGTSTSQPQVGVKITTTLYVGAAKKLDSGATATYQWYRVDAKTGKATAISGATGSSYTPVAADVGYKIRVTATGTGSYKGTVTATHSKATVAAKSSAVLDDAFATFDWETEFAEL